MLYLPTDLNSDHCRNYWHRKRGEYNCWCLGCWTARIKNYF